MDRQSEPMDVVGSEMQSESTLAMHDDRNPHWPAPEIDAGPLQSQSTKALSRGIAIETGNEVAIRIDDRGLEQ
jgi:hypothetical protein